MKNSWTLKIESCTK